MEQTLIIIKPDAVQRGLSGEILRRFEQRGLRIIGLKFMKVSQALAQSLCLILPSYEEQFGIVVLEALAAGVPVIVSTNCGSRDRHVRSGVNGFLIESGNAEGLARYLEMLGSDKAMWERMAAAATKFASLGDARHFAHGVKELIGSR